MKTDTEKKKRIADVEKQIYTLKEELAELKRKDVIEVPHELLKSLGFKFKDNYWRKRREDGSDAILDIRGDYWELELTTNSFYLERDSVYGDSAESLIDELNRYDTWPKLVTFEVSCNVGPAKVTGLEIEAWSDADHVDLVEIASQALSELDITNMETKVIA